MKMTRSEENLADLDFIITELNKQASWSHKDYDLHWEEHPEDKFEIIPLTDGSFRHGTSETRQRFYQLAHRNSEKSTERSSFDLDSFVTELKKQFAETFVVRGQQLNQLVADEFVEDAMTRLLSKREITTHYIPCDIFSGNEPSHFSIGDITFYSAPEFQNRFGDCIDAYFREEQTRVRKVWQDNEKKGIKRLPE